MTEWLLDTWRFLPGGAWFVLTFVFVAWCVLGWFLAPWIFKSFEKRSSGYIAWMVETFDRMFLAVSARQCTLMILVSMGVFFFLGFAVLAGLPIGTGYNTFRLAFALFLAVGPFGIPTGYNLPRVVVESMWARRIDRFEIQMLDGLTFMSNGLKSGLSLIQSMDMVKDEMDNPIAEEFALVLSQQRLGVPLEDALLGLEDRIGTEDVQIMVTSINILRQSGGNLTETFDTIAETVRERKKVEGRIKTLTAQGKSQGVIITFMPFVLAGILFVLDPDLIRRLWTTPIGLFMMVMMLTLQIVGAVIIKRVVTIEV